MSLNQDDFGVGSNGYLAYRGIPIHRWVARQSLGRSFRAGEIVHHKDGNKLNAHPDNLAVIFRHDHNPRIQQPAKQHIVILPPQELLDRLECATRQEIICPGVRSVRFPVSIKSGYRIDEDLLGAFRVLCKERGVTPSWAVRQSIKLLVRQGSLRSVFCELPKSEKQATQMKCK